MRTAALRRAPSHSFTNIIEIREMKRSVCRNGWKCMWCTYFYKIPYSKFYKNCIYFVGLFRGYGFFTQTQRRMKRNAQHKTHIHSPMFSKILPLEKAKNSECIYIWLNSIGILWVYCKLNSNSEAGIFLSNDYVY